MVVGAGTVLAQAQAELAIEAGAGFAVAPAGNSEVIRHCRERGLPFFPGIATPSELDIPGDTSMATLDEVERLRRGASPRVQR
jgi:2-dehydro-3-deoxyphosphogluconate aldolase/(4S)-4-hydroxy-2-oxoglutarate aldolase